MATGAERQADLKARRQAAGLVLVSNLWTRPELVPIVRQAAAGVSVSALTTTDTSEVGLKTITDPSVETTAQLCYSMEWQFRQLDDPSYRATGQGVIKRIQRELEKRLKDGKVTVRV